MANIADIIKYEGGNNTFIWKHPCEDFNTSTQLIVYETQEAILFLNGQALDLFGPGRHTLETQNIPLISKIINIPTKSNTPFHCEVYFINKVDQMGIKWGTDSKIQYIEPFYHFPLSIGASGELALSVSDSRKLLLKLVGTENNLERQNLISYFRGILMTKLKSYMAQIIKTKQINIFEIDEQLDLFSAELKSLLIPFFLDYGVNLVQFFVTNIVKPDGDTQYEQFKDLHFRQYSEIAEAQLKQKVGIINQQTEAQKMVIESQALAQKRSQEGYTYQQERSFDVAEGAATNESSSSNFASLGVGLGMMSGIGSKVGTTVGNMVGSTFVGLDNASEQTALFCEQCGASIIPGASFCDNCGASIKLDFGVCTKCNYKFTKPGKFCPKCGNKREV